MNEIHPTAIIDPSVILGTGNKIGPFCIIGPGVTIGSNNVFTSHVSIGQPAQHRTSKLQNLVTIGSDNVFREFVTVHAGTVRKTVVGDRGYFMACSHISHDTIIEDDVTMANCALLGGHCYVMKGANIGLNVSVHQYQVIGSYSMIGMGSVILKPGSIFIYPGRKYVGSPAKEYGINRIALERAGYKLPPKDEAYYIPINNIITCEIDRFTDLAAENWR